MEVVGDSVLDLTKSLAYKYSRESVLRNHRHEYVSFELSVNAS